VPRIREIVTVLALAACSSFLCNVPGRAAAQQTAPQGPEGQSPEHVAQAAEPQAGPSDQQVQPAAAEQAKADAGTGTLGRLVVTVGKSLIIDSPIDIRRLSVADGNLAEAVAVNPKEVLINGKLAGETSLIVWQQNGARLVYDLTVRISNARLDAVRQQIARDFPEEDINVTFENDTAFIRGTVKDLIGAERVVAIATTLGKTVNLLRVQTPGMEPQVLLKVRFANIDRASTMNLGMNIWNGSFNQGTSLGTGSALYPDEKGNFPVGQLVNILLLRPDLNLAAELQALENKRLLELLAEPNLLAISGQQASFLAGGEFPFPMVQPGQGQAAISLAWREYGVRLNFQPVVTARGTIRLKVAPEVSSLDYANAVTVQGITVPGISSRRVTTEVELESGQSFIIAGLLDKQTSESFSKVPGISAIPIIGKLFQSKSINRNNSELMVIITPEIVRPIAPGQTAPELKFTTSHLTKNTAAPISNPTGGVPARAIPESIPVEQLMKKDGRPPVMAEPAMQAPAAQQGSAAVAAPAATGGTAK
jgi:pilus assembly protein CpaC